MKDLSFGLTVTAAVVVVMLVVGAATALYCKWAERRDREQHGIGGV
jgi:hypothetical protein